MDGTNPPFQFPIWKLTNRGFIFQKFTTKRKTKHERKHAAKEMEKQRKKMKNQITSIGVPVTSFA